MIDDNKEFSIIIKVSYEGDINDLPLKWVNINLKSCKMFDITNGEGIESIELKYDKEIFNLLKEKYFKEYNVEKRSPKKN